MSKSLSITTLSEMFLSQDFKTWVAEHSHTSKVCLYDLCKSNKTIVTKKVFCSLVGKHLVGNVKFKLQSLRQFSAYHTDTFFNLFLDIIYMPETFSRLNAKHWVCEYWLRLKAVVLSFLLEAPSLRQGRPTGIRITTLASSLPGAEVCLTTYKMVLSFIHIEVIFTVLKNFPGTNKMWLKNVTRRQIFLFLLVECQDNDAKVRKCLRS